VNETSLDYNQITQIVDNLDRNGITSQFDDQRDIKSMQIPPKGSKSQQKAIIPNKNQTNNNYFKESTFEVE